MSSILDPFAAETEATSEEIDALRARVAARLDPGRVSRGLLAHITQEVTAAEVVALRSRLIARRRQSSWTPFAIGLSGAMLAAAAALFVLRTGSVAPEIGPAPIPLAAELAPTSPALHTPRMDLRATGTGTVSGTEEAPRIAWQQGALAVDVVPERGTDLQIETREARIRVVGTAFTVQRDAYGTRVDVSRGKVEVTCLSGGVHLLQAEQDVVCWPTSAPGLLGRAKALRKDGAPAGEILATVDAALPSADGPFRDELSALRAELLTTLGRSAEALAEARAFLARVPRGERRLEVLRIAAPAAYTAEGCAGALPYLRELEDAGAGDADLLLRCEDR